jgi:hypothetical protein
LEHAVKFFALLFSFLFAFMYTSRIPAAALEATVSADVSGRPSVQAKVPVNKIGALLLADASAILSGDSVEISSNHPGTNNQPLLQGQILKAEQAADGIHGIMFFKGGAKLSQLCRKGATERIQTTDGNLYQGSISGVGPDGVDMTLQNGATQHFALSALKCVDSGCAFEFNLANDSSKIAFARCTLAAVVTEKVRPVQQQHVLVGGNCSKTRKIILGLVLLTVIATAIAVPVAVGCATHHHHHSNNSEEIALLLRNRSSSSSSQSSNESAAQRFFFPFGLPNTFLP